MSQGMTPEFVLGYRAMMLDGITREAETTKKVLAAVPDDKADYRPDPHARTARELSKHIATVDVQFLDAIADMSFDKMDADVTLNSTAETVAWYDENMKRGISRVQGMTAEQLMTSVNFMNLFNLPAAFYLGFLNNHSIHHRGELATYLRPMGSKCPSIYGGSYDEPFQMPEPAQTAA